MKYHTVTALCIALSLVRFSVDSPGGVGAVSSPIILPTTNRVMEDGEDLLYEVRWTWFKLGTVRLKAGRDFTSHAFINSYPDVPFVDLHAVQYTSMDSMFFSRASHSAEKVNGEWVGLNYVTDSTKSRLYVEKTYSREYSATPYKREWADTLQLSGAPFIDGLSIGYFPRLFIQTRQTISVLTILNGKLGTTVFRYTNDRTPEDIEVLDSPVRSVRVEGNTTVEGIFGMTGDFTGWFSDDSAAIPIKGELKVLIGSVTIELIAWKREGWTPPLVGQ